MPASQNNDGHSAGALRVLEIAPAWAMGELDPCLVVVWRGETTPEAFRLRNNHLEDLAARARGKCALIEVIEPSSKAPSQDTRRVAMEVFKKLGSDLSAVGMVIEGSEVRSTLARAVVTGMMFFVRQLQPTKVFKETKELVGWVQPRLQGLPADYQARLDGALDELRQRMQALATATP